MGTKANMPGDEFWLVGFQFMSSEQAVVIRRAECEEGRKWLTVSCRGGLQPIREQTGV